MKKEGTYEYLDFYPKYGNKAHLISVGKRIIFVAEQKTGSFVAKLKIVNQSKRYVSYMVRASDHAKFSIKPRFDFIAPRRQLDVIIFTKKVTAFREISQASFCVFAVPIYDQRQLERKSLSLLWKAHGTDIFPYDVTEIHRIPLILPLDDTYFDDLSILDRLHYMQHVFYATNDDKPELYQNKNKIIEDELPTLERMIKTGEMDPTFAEIIADWHVLVRKMHFQTNVVMENMKITMAMIITGASTLIGIVGLSTNGFIDLCGRNKGENCSAVVEEKVELTGEKEFVGGVWSWIQSWWSWK